MAVPAVLFLGVGTRQLALGSLHGEAPLMPKSAHMRRMIGAAKLLMNDLANIGAVHTHYR